MSSPWRGPCKALLADAVLAEQERGTCIVTRVRNLRHTSPMPMMRESPALSIHDVVADEVLDCAYRWLCERRKFYPDAADIWSFRRDWPGERERLRQEGD